MDVETQVHRFFRAIDQRDWEAVHAALADQVDTDYTEMSGGAPERLDRDQLLGRWQGLLPGFDATQHFLGPLLVDDGLVECNVRGYHRLDDQTWKVAGWYVLKVGLDERINGITLKVSYQSGNPDLPARATQRAASSAR